MERESVEQVERDWERETVEAERYEQREQNANEDDSTNSFSNPDSNFLKLQIPK